jgi:DNA-binding NtrC family response regulator
VYVILTKRAVISINLEEERAAIMAGECVISRTRIMVANQDAEFALKLADSLAADGYEVAIVQEAGEILDLLRNMEPDGILLDLHLSVPDSMKLLQNIRAVHPHVPVITMADPALHDVAARSVKAGARTFLLKPFDFQHVRDLLGAELRVSDTKRTQRGAAGEANACPES